MFDRRDVFVVVHGTWIQSSGIEPSAQGTDRPVSYTHLGVIELLHQLNETGCCEFLCEPYSHGLSSLANEDCFLEEVERMRTKIKQIFGKEPKVFRNSSLIYSSDIGATIADMGFKGMLTEGAKHILGWKSPHYLDHCAMRCV